MSGHDEDYSLKIEATEVIKEIKFAVLNVKLSDKLKSTDELVYMNIETLEKQALCVELSARGFRVRSQKSIIQTFYLPEVVVFEKRCFWHCKKYQASPPLPTPGPKSRQRFRSDNSFCKLKPHHFL